MKKIFLKIRSWWICNNLPFITTAKREMIMLASCNKALMKQDRHFFCVIIKPVISSLKELRNNTWDKGRVDHDIEWLEQNFTEEL